MNQYKKTFNKIKHLTKPEFSTDYWNKKCQLISKEFCKDLPKDFLQNPHIKETMVAANEMKAMQQLGYIQKYWGDKAEDLLEEPDVGGLTKLTNLEKHSCNIINHVYFATKFVKHHEKLDSKPTSFVEIGGGFGTLAMVFKRIYPDTQYTIIDVPAITTLQSIYLKELAVVDGDTEGYKINLVPIGTEDFIFGVSQFPPDALIAMWSIGEVSAEMNDWALSIESRSFMVGTHNWKCGSFNQASRVYNYFNDKSIYKEEVGPKNHLMIK